MPWSLGTFTRAITLTPPRSGSVIWGNDQSGGIKIKADRHDDHDEDLADGINACLNKAGENAMTGDLDVGANKLTNVATGTVSTDGINLAQLTAVNALVSTNTSDIATNTADIATNTAGLATAIQADGSIPLTTNWSFGDFLLTGKGYVATDTVVSFGSIGAYDEVSAGDNTLTATQLFYMNAIDATTPALQFDSNDYLAYDRTANEYQFVIGGATGLTFDGTSITGSVNYINGNSTQNTVISGGSTASLGSNIIMYAESHATLANDFLIRASGTTVLQYDHSLGAIGVYADISMNTGEKIFAGTIEASNVSLSTGVTVASLSTTTGAIQRVTDALGPVVGSPVVGGGAVTALVWRNATGWNVLAI